VMRPRSSSRGRNTSASVTVTVTVSKYIIYIVPKSVPNMIYNVFVGTLNLALSIYIYLRRIRARGRAHFSPSQQLVFLDRRCSEDWQQLMTIPYAASPVVSVGCNIVVPYLFRVHVWNKRADWRRN